MQVAASIASGDLARLADMAVAAEAGGADRVHLDIEDGAFVPTFTVGPRVTAAIRQAVHRPLEVHLQTLDPGRWIATITAARPNRIIVHPETHREVGRLLRMIRDAGAAAGLALLLETPVEVAIPFLDVVDQITLMATGAEPDGAFHPTVLAKARALRGRVAVIELDGGVTPEIVPAVTDAGVTVVVAGRAIFSRGVDRIAESIAALRGGSG